MAKPSDAGEPLKLALLAGLLNASMVDLIDANSPVYVQLPDGSQAPLTGLAFVPNPRRTVLYVGELVTNEDEQQVSNWLYNFARGRMTIESLKRKLAVKRPERS